ncbi:MAG: hypothetical protein WD733_19140 [Bryobacterales bacterium]
MTTRQEIQKLVEELPDEHVDELRRYVQDLHATEVDEEPLSPDDLASIENGLQDIRAGRFKTLDEYKRERGQ